MAGLPPRPNLDLTLPSRPDAGPSTLLVAPLASRPLASRISGFSTGLPSRPSLASRLSTPDYDSRPRRSPSPLYFDSRRSAGDSYRPRIRSPSPRPLRSRDTWAAPDSYVPEAPIERRSHRERDDIYIPRESEERRPTSTPRALYARPESASRPTRSPSPIQSKSFFTRAHRIAESRAEHATKRSIVQQDKSRLAVSGQSLQHKDLPAVSDRTPSAKEEERDVRSEEHPRKRSHPLPTPGDEQPAKVAKSIPTGPRSQRPLQKVIPGAPLGPRALYTHRSSTAVLAPGVPTGPRASAGVATFSTSSAHQTRTRSRSPAKSSVSQSSNSSMTRSGSSKSRHHSGKQQKGKQQNDFKGPLSNLKRLKEQYDLPPVTSTQMSDLMKRLAEDYGTLEFDRTTGSHGGAKVVRSTLRVPSMVEAGDVTGTGDNAQAVEADRLAALSFLGQLQAKGLWSKQKISTFLQAEPELEVKLTNGSTIQYDTATTFMDYYTRRYKFGQPTVDYTYQSTPTGGTVWEAVISVGGRKIGMGTSSSKKDAKVKCFLDVAQYLESCDPDLWTHFMQTAGHKAKAKVSIIPAIGFQLSRPLETDMSGLCEDIRGSSLYQNAPSSTTITGDDQALPSNWYPADTASEDQLDAKSSLMKERLETYSTNPSTSNMRKQRASLPIMQGAKDLVDIIQSNEVTIIMAATGSGKTTQVPQIILDHYIERGEGARCNVLCTQPRRLAAMSVSERIADERGQSLGEEVGYQVRFDLKLPEPEGTITFCTTGIFLRKMQNFTGDQAKDLDHISHIVIDEVHERDIDTDLSLMVLKRLLADRRARGNPLKVILMSATIDPTLFKDYFKDTVGKPAPVMEIPGRTFPVKRYHLDDVVPELRRLGGHVFGNKIVMQYLQKELDNKALVKSSGSELPVPHPLVALYIAHVIKQSNSGHVLVFLPGWQDIKATAGLLRGSSGYQPMGVNFADSSKYEIHFLHSSVPPAEQKQVFTTPPAGIRRIILATNIAETSLTIPDVVYVVDTGRVKESRFDPCTHMSSLISAWAGASNLNQRAGRAGRHRPGEYYSLVSTQRQALLDPHQMVEMKRSDLSNVVMHVKMLNLGSVEDVLGKTIEPPEPERVRLAIESLLMLGAMDQKQNLSPLGRVLAQIPIEAAIGKLCLFGAFFKCLDSALTLAAVLTSRDPFMAPEMMKKQADSVKNSWAPLSFRSDPLAIVAAYRHWDGLVERRDDRSAHMFIQDNFLNRTSLYSIKQLKTALLKSLEQTGIIAVSSGLAPTRFNRGNGFADQLNENGNSLPLLAALIAIASAPKFALQMGKQVQTAQDTKIQISMSSVNHPTRLPAPPTESLNDASLYAFVEKTRNLAPGAKESSAQIVIRQTTELDPLTYMLFGSHDLGTSQEVVGKSRLLADSWLSVEGESSALQVVQRLKSYLNTSMLRVFEGLSRSLGQSRESRIDRSRNSVDVAEQGSSVIRGDNEDGDDVSDDEKEVEEGDDETDRIVQPLFPAEIKELGFLTTDVVRVLDAYAAERTAARTPSGNFQGNRGYQRR